MATTRRDPGAGLLCVVTLLGLCAAGQSAWAQAPSRLETPELGTEPVPVTQIQPIAGVELRATDNARGTSDSGAPRKDLILKTMVGATVNVKGANSRIEGQWRFTTEKFARHSKPSHTLPSGLLTLHSDLYRKEIGVDASVSAEQTPSATGLQSDGNTTTTTRSISPFFVKQFDADASLVARLKRTWSHVSSSIDGLADRSSEQDAHMIRWERRPARLGYALDASYLGGPPTTGSNASPSFTSKKARASLLYAITPELVAGPLLGRDISQLDGNTQRATIRGGQLRWRPNEHTLFDSEITHAAFGKEWVLVASRKTPWMTLRFDSRRKIDVQSASNTLPGTAPTFGPQASESTSGSMLFEGRRDKVAVKAGLTRSTPLAASGNRTKGYFFDTEVSHRLTPLSNLTGGLHWTRGWTFFSSALGSAETPTLTRDFTARLGLDTKLAPDTTAMMGFKRQLTHNPSTSTSAESAAYVGLGYRF